VAKGAWTTTAIEKALTVPASAVSVTATAEDARTFTDISVASRSSYLHFPKLYEDRGDEGVAELARVAPIFFGDLAAMLKEHIIMAACKITDPAKTRKSHNQTTHFFIDHCDFSADPKRAARLRELAGRMNEFRKHIDSARNKLIAHSDRDALFANVNLGRASMQEWQSFWLDLQDFVCLLHEHFFRETFFLNGVGMLTDADSLTRIINIGLDARDGRYPR